jgi:uncharacterized protein (DUF1778 family)
MAAATVTLNARITPETRRLIEQLAQERNLSMTALIKIAVERLRRDEETKADA